MPPNPKSSIAGFILTGGKSSRMGVDKAFVEFRGRTLLERAIETMRGVCEAVTIVGDAAKFAHFGPTVSDVYPGCGPLGGIHAALLSSSAEINLVMAVDMPFVSAELLAFLLEMASETDATVVVPHTSSGFQPLCAVYRREFATPAEEALRTGQYKIGALFSAVTIRVIEDEELTRAGFAQRMFFNINKPDDLRMASEDT